MSRAAVHAADRRPSISGAVIQGFFQLADLAPKVSAQTREMALAIAYIHQLNAWFASETAGIKREKIKAGARARRSRLAENGPDGARSTSIAGSRSAASEEGRD